MVAHHNAGIIQQLPVFKNDQLKKIPIAARLSLYFNMLRTALIQSYPRIFPKRYKKSGYFKKTSFHIKRLDNISLRYYDKKHNKKVKKDRGINSERLL